MTSRRVALADDAILFPEGLARILTGSGFEVIGQVGDGDALIDLVRSDPPDVAVIDLRMPPTHSSKGWTPQLSSVMTPQRSACCCSPSTSRHTMHCD